MSDQPHIASVPTGPRSRFVVDEIHVQLIVRELDATGETIAKHAPEPMRFVNERAFREWAAQPFHFVDQRDRLPDA
jgi:hypothetical protein